MCLKEQTDQLFVAEISLRDSAVSVVYDHLNHGFADLWVSVGNLMQDRPLSLVLRKVDHCLIPFSTEEYFR
jgi:hypothetical protein